MLRPDELINRWSCAAGREARDRVIAALCENQDIRPILKAMPGAEEVFDWTDLRGIDLSGLSFSSDLFVAADLDFALMKGCELFDSAFDNAHMAYGIFDGATFQRTQLSNVRALRASFEHAKFESALMMQTDFSYSSFRGAALMDSDFSRCQCEHADFRGSTLRRVSFRNARLIGADFSGATFEKCDFTGALIHNTDIPKQAVTLGG